MVVNEFCIDTECIIYYTYMCLEPFKLLFYLYVWAYNFGGHSLCATGTKLLILLVTNEIAYKWVTWTF